MGDSTIRAAAKALRTIDSPHWKKAGSTTRTGPPAGSRARRVHAPIPINTTIIDHIEACLAEVRELIEDIAREADTPRPCEPADLYAWAAAVTGTEGEHHARLEAIAWRHMAETTLHTGDPTPIRREPCPACHTWGLSWVKGRGAVCLNVYCAEQSPDGQHRVWTLRQLGEARAQKIMKRAATY